MVKSNVTALAAVQTAYKARLDCKYREATIVHGKYLLLVLRVEKVVKIVNDLCKSQKSRVANIHPLTKVI